jgi:hypothetical protein
MKADRPSGRGRTTLDTASGGGSPHASRRWAWTGFVQAEGRKASGALRWIWRLMAGRPTPHGVGLGQVSYKPKAVRPILFGTRDAGRVDPHLAWLGAPRSTGFQPVSVHRGGSGLPTPSRRTFVSALQASTLCMSAALRHPGCACSHSPLEGMGSPSLSSRLSCAASNPACRSGRGCASADYRRVRMKASSSLRLAKPMR